MMDVLLGKKFSEKDLAKTMECLIPELHQGESLVCAVRALGTRPPVDTFVITNQRIIILYRGMGRAVQGSHPISDIRRLAFDGSTIFIRTTSDEDLRVCSLSHSSEDSALVRSAFASVGEQVSPKSNPAKDPTAEVQASPRTKEKALREGIAKVDTYLQDGEKLLYALEDNADWYFITDLRLITLTGIWKVNAQELDLTQYIRVEVEADGSKWIVAAADSQQNYALIGKLNREDEARWLAQSIESTYPHMADLWRDDLREFLESLGLSYAFESLFPLLWPGIEGERLIWGFGSGEDDLIFTSLRLAVLPDLIAIPIESVSEVTFAIGRHEHYSHTGSLVSVAYGLSCQLRLSDGRRFTRLLHFADSERQFNDAIPQITAALRELASAGYPVFEGEEWVEQSQSAPPSQRYATGYSMEFEAEGFDFDF